MTVDTTLTNLPLQLTSFIGREREIAEVKHLLATTHLLTLSGAGGCGKTRLALQVAADLRDEFLDGVWFVELAPLSDSGLVSQTVAFALGLQDQSGRPMLDALKDYLKEKNLLLVLDNCEHLIDACVRVADVLLHHAPRIKILATSREAIGIAGETSFRVPSLALPDAKNLPLLEALSQCEAVRLFIDRASSAQPSFTVTNANANAVADICYRLDGIPLAIELAAARIKALKPEEIAARLDDSFRLLTGGSRTALPRQQTLRATMDWSYNLLLEPERVLLQRLSVFAGGATLAAAEEICAGEGTAREELLDLLAHLADKSILIVDESKEATRYKLLETIRQYAREKLLESGEGENVRNRHLDYFLKFAEEVEPKLRGPEQFEWLDRLDIEQDNLRAALEWSLGAGRVEKGLRFAAALMWFWDMRQYWSEGRQHAESLLNQPEAAAKTLTRANALLVAANHGTWMNAAMMRNQHLEELIGIARKEGVAGKRVLALGLGFLGELIFGDNPATAESMLEEGLAAARSLGDEWLIGYLLGGRGYLFMGRQDHRAARQAFEESLTRFKSLGDKYRAAIVSFLISRVYFQEREYARARREFEEGLSFFRQTKNRGYVWATLNSLGEIARAEGRYDLAKRIHGEALEIAPELGNKFSIAVTSSNSGYVALHDGELNAARSLFAESLALARGLDSKPSVAAALLGFAGLAAAEKQGGRAVRLLAVYDALIETDKRTVNPADEAEYNRHLAIAREQLDKATFNTAWEEGRAMTLEQAVEYALVEQVEDSQPIGSAQPHDPNALTPREIEVLRLVQAGLSDAKIAEKLVISRRTVNTHLSSIYSKLGVNSRSAATRYALDHKLI